MSFVVHGQYLKSPSDIILSKTSLRKTLFEANFQRIFVFNEISFWFKSREYYVIKQRDKDIESFKVSIKKRKNFRLGRTKSQRINIDTKKVLRVIDYMDSVGFWSFSGDSLNLDSKANPNGGMLTISVFDGSSYEFEMINDSARVLISVTNPEPRQRFVPTQQRAIFINCKNDLFDLFKKN
ncbi:hypothetical protein [Marinoscillum sp.]|uniref:hypothetical protein n=1 Tax=Marinoscillum sp. TaxID=2024838 RepID=UPI003BAB47A1